MNWQPIETAPKDGRLLLANQFGTWVGYFCPVFSSGYRPSHPWQSLLLNHKHMEHARYHLKPTHWMPLPEPPQ